MSNKNISSKMRIWHRYLGFFLAGIMLVYSLSGIVLIFRNTDFLKKETIITKTIDPNVPKEELGKKLGIKELTVTEEKEGKLYFKEGFYDSKTGEAQYKSKTLPKFISKMTKLHKANSKDPLFFLNVFFGLSLLFFVVSSFFMFAFKTTPFKKGVYVAIAGFILAMILLFI
jgi:hypothetical protein